MESCELFGQVQEAVVTLLLSGWIIYRGLVVRSNSPVGPVIIFLRLCQDFETGHDNFPFGYREGQGWCEILEGLGFGRTMLLSARPMSFVIASAENAPSACIAEIHHLIPTLDLGLLTDLERSVVWMNDHVRFSPFHNGRRTRHLRPCLLHRRCMLFEWSCSLVLLPRVLFRISLRTRLSLREV